MTRLKNTEEIPEEWDEGISIKEWAKISGMSYATLYGRLKRGWPMSEVLYRKVRHHKASKGLFNPRTHEKVGEIAENINNPEDECLIRQLT